MVVTRGCFGSGFGADDGLGSGFGVGFMDDHMREFILAEITRSILEHTPVIFVTFKEDILEIPDERLGAFLFWDGGDGGSPLFDFSRVSRIWGSRVLQKEGPNCEQGLVSKR